MMSWAERAADRSPIVQKSRSRGVEQAESTVRAARRLIEVKGPSFTTQELIREAGIALQTFYRYFPSKDHLMLAVLEDIIDEACQTYKKAADNLRDPLERIRLYVTTPLAGLDSTPYGPSFITSEHWRLQIAYPEEVSHATQPFTDLITQEIQAANAAGALSVEDPQDSAWLITQLTMAVFHHYDTAGLRESSQRAADRLWSFCLAALGGTLTGRGKRRSL